MLRGLSWIALTILTLFAAALSGCGGEDRQAERQRPKDPTTVVGSPETVGVGETAEVGPFAVTLNSATRSTGNGGRFAVVDLTLENSSQQPADASDADYLLRDEDGYSFETGSAPDQRPRPEGQIEPGDRASGQVGFELGEEPADGRLALSVTLPEEPEAREARFEFEAEEAKKEPEPKPEPEPEPEPEAAEKNEPSAPSVRAGYSRVEDPSGSLSVEVPSSWSSETGADSENEADEGSWSYYAGEYLTASITTATSLDAWYAPPGSVAASGAYLAASETLAQYSDDELIYSLLNQKREANCTAGPSREIERAPYSGKIQTWFDCNGTGATSYSFAAAPEGRPCVVVGTMRVDQAAPDADREGAEHIIDSFEVDCGFLPPAEPLESSATASPEATTSASASASQSAGAETEMASCGDFRAMSGEPSQWQAQQYYDFAATPEEKAILDPDGDGFACEDLEPGVGGTDEEGRGASPEPSSPEPSSPDPSSPEPVSPPPAGGDVNCDDVSQDQAQEIYDRDPSDPNGLDGDGDGEACE